MVPTSDFSGLVSSACALASAAARLAIDSLRRCMASPRSQEVEADGSRFRALGSDAMADRLLGVLRHQALKLRLGLLVLEVGVAGARKDAGELRPGVRRSHVDDADGLDARLGRFDTEQARRLAALHAAP